jgi:unsaturated chondroitin disaccharide hydrolase
VPVGSFGTRGLERHAATDPGAVAAVDAGYTATGLLWRAADLTGDERYRRVARRHTDTHLRWFVRDDGSVWHKASFDPETGSLERRYNQLTRVPDACWARGLGWSIAGLVDAYNATGDPDYLAALERHVAYYRRWTPDDDVPFAELGPDVPETYRDTSGAALAAYGLVRLADDGHVDPLREFGRGILSSLANDYLVTEGPLRGQLRSGCYNAVDGVATNHELVWSIYYFLVALASVSRDR